MMRRSLVAMGISTAILGPMAGCGMAIRKLEGEPMLQLGTVSRTFPESSHRVAVAAFEAMERELAWVRISGEQGFEFFAQPDLKTYRGKTLREGDALPPNYPAFWIEWKQGAETIHDLMTLGAGHFAGKARGGERVNVSVMVGPEGKTLATVHVGRLGDPEVSSALLDRITDRLAHPAHPPGSAEEAAMFRSFFGGVEKENAQASSGKAKGEATKSAATGPVGRESR